MPRQPCFRTAFLGRSPRHGRLCFSKRLFLPYRERTVSRAAELFRRASGANGRPSLTETPAAHGSSLPGPARRLIPPFCFPQRACMRDSRRAARQTAGVSAPPQAGTCRKSRIPPQKNASGSLPPRTKEPSFPGRRCASAPPDMGADRLRKAGTAAFRTEAFPVKIRRPSPHSAQTAKAHGRASRTFNRKELSSDHESHGTQT